MTTKTKKPDSIVDTTMSVEMIKDVALAHIHPNSISLRQFGLPKSREFIKEVLDHKHCKTKRLSENPRATYAAFCIMEGLIRDSKINEDAYYRGEYQFEKLIFTPFTMTRAQASTNFRVDDKYIEIAQKALEELGLIWVEENHYPHQNEEGDIYKYTHQGLTFTATPKFRKEEFFFSFSDFYIPTNRLPFYEPEDFTKIEPDGNRFRWCPMSQDYIPFADNTAA